MQTFEFNCTLPVLSESSVHFVKNPGVRSTLQIIWISLTTLFVCVYQVLKLNLPDPRDAPLYPATTRVLKTAGLALLVLLAPEVVLTESIFELQDAQRKQKRLTAAGNDYANGHEHASRHEWSLIQAFYLNMGGFVLACPGSTILEPVDGPTFEQYIRSGQLAAKPSATDQEIMDKSKDDAFSKTIAIGQILYFSIDFLSRLAQERPVSQLELAIASIALYSILSYILQWWKPKGIETQTIIQLNSDAAGNAENTQTRGTISELFRELTRMILERFRKSDVPVLPSCTTVAHASRRCLTYLRIIRNGQSSGPEDDTPIWMAICCLMLSIPPGAIHLIGWTFEFPTAIDKWLWRSSSLAITGTGPLCAALVALLTWCLGGFRKIHSNCLAVTLISVFVVLYTAARLVLIVLVARLLFYLPPGAFQATSWSMSIPHIG